MGLKDIHFVVLISGDVTEIGGMVQNTYGNKRCCQVCQFEMRFSADTEKQFVALFRFKIRNKIHVLYAVQYRSRLFYLEELFIYYILLKM